jgi:hypothetical protein
VTLEIHDARLSNSILEFIRSEALDSASCDIFLSILSEYDTRIYDVPEGVLELIRKCRCKVTVSFTSVV